MAEATMNDGGMPPATPQGAPAGAAGAGALPIPTIGGGGNPLPATMQGVAGGFGQFKQWMDGVLRQHQIDSTGRNTPAVMTPPTPEVGKPTFGEAIANAVVKTNDVQQQASELRQAYDRGEDVPLTDVVLAMQKSSLAFEATLQIRNKVLKAYEDILNMPV